MEKSAAKLNCYDKKVFKMTMHSKITETKDIVD